jgi:hypothetical protein
MECCDSRFAVCEIQVLLYVKRCLLYRYEILIRVHTFNHANVLTLHVCKCYLYKHTNMQMLHVYKYTNIQMLTICIYYAYYMYKCSTRIIILYTRAVWIIPGHRCEGA